MAAKVSEQLKQQIAGMGPSAELAAQTEGAKQRAKQLADLKAKEQSGQELSGDEQNLKNQIEWITRSGGEQEQAINKLQQAEAGQKSRLQDVLQGAQFAETVLGEGLGRTDAGVMKQLQGLARGYDAPQLQAQREQALKGIQQSQSGALRSLAAAQARAGLRGGTAVAQQAGILGAGIQAKQNLEQQLLVGQRQAQFEGVQALQQAQQFDLAQAAREKFAVLSSGLGYAQLGLAERGGQAAAEATVKAAQAQSGGGGLFGK